MAKKNTAAIAEELAAPILEEMGLQLWDVVYEKEGSGWYLRYYVDKEGGIDINSCEAFPGQSAMCWMKPTPSMAATRWRFPPPASSAPSPAIGTLRP